MLRGMMLALVLLLITLSAAHLGRDPELQEVLRLARTPKPTPSQSQSISSEPEPPRSRPPESSSSAPQESRPPRFVLDEPLESLPPLPEEASSGAGLDPSAQAKASSSGVDSDPSSAVVIRIPTEEEARAAADPYVKELYELTARSLEQLAELEKRALTDYLSTPPDQRADALPGLAERYLPQVTALEKDADGEAERIFNRMTAALAAIGAEDAITEEARRAYAKEKADQLQHYAELFAGTTRAAAPPKAAESGNSIAGVSSGGSVSAVG